VLLSPVRAFFLLHQEAEDGRKRRTTGAAHLRKIQPLGPFTQALMERESWENRRGPS
jgi:hypothetical protein